LVFVQQIIQMVTAAAGVRSEHMTGVSGRAQDRVRYAGWE